MNLSQKPFMKSWSTTISTHKARNEDDPLCADECYTIKKNSCKIHLLSTMKRLVIPEMCELYNIFIKSYNTVANIAAQLYKAVLDKPEENKKRDTEYFDDPTPSLNTE